MQIVYGDICEAACSVIVNASNGIGYMGGKRGMRKRLPGVAESIHFMTGGKVEREAKKHCRAHSVFGLAPGSVFLTNAYDLHCSCIIHAVTMRYPGTFTSLNTVKKLLPAILEQARACGAKSIAIPLLGAGTGSLSKERVLALYESFFASVQDIEVLVYIYKKP